MVEYKTNVKIDGKEYTLVSDEPKENINQIAEIFDRKIKEVKNDKLTFDRALILAGINITDDLYKLALEYQDIKEKSKKPLEDYPKLTEEVNNLKEENENIKKEIDQLKDQNKKLTDEKNSLERKISKANISEDTIKKLRDQLKDLQKQMMDLQSENQSLKEKL